MSLQVMLLHGWKFQLIFFAKFLNPFCGRIRYVILRLVEKETLLALLKLLL